MDLFMPCSDYLIHLNDYEDGENWVNFYRKYLFALKFALVSCNIR